MPSRTVTPTCTRLTLPSAEISLLRWSPEHPRATTVVLLHGAGADTASLSWGEVGPALAAAGYDVVAPDHPGYGASPVPGWPPTQERLVDYVGELVDILGLERYVVCGLSLGGGLSLGHALARPDGPRGVIAMAAYGLTPWLADGALGPVLHAFTWALLRTGALGVIMRWSSVRPGPMEASLRTLVRDPAHRTPALLIEALEAARSTPGMASFARFQRDEVSWRRLRTDYGPRLHKIAVPTLVVHGERDTAVPVARARAAVDALPRGTGLIVPGAGHWVQRDRPDLVVPAVLRFLEEIG